jgi:hypothetical protein
MSERKRINSLEKLAGFMPFETQVDGQLTGRVVGVVKKKVLSRNQNGTREKGFFVIVLSEPAMVSDHGSLIEAVPGQAVGVRLVASTDCLAQCMGKEVEVQFIETRTKGEKTYYDIAVSV